MKIKEMKIKETKIAVDYPDQYGVKVCRKIRGEWQ